ncbi:lamin tail domain-containing protein [Paenibacillus sp. KQZ6P-2]|uniref:Lamin tail domain-containing protein n=1 Tax=Paenibacillus mangrovi TaxID=2931978 RepID=A0A9X1WQX1_9BACL|nr:lamin tail domain-containing protein [Paenibacillus mangrovi]MCJ8013434.1 lamin tail domain-containing protein [Paenibacillus mangrovi]
MNKRSRWRRAMLFIWMFALLALPFVGLAPQGTAHAAAAEPDLMITEIVPQSIGTGQPYEYVEIYNNTTSPINLDGYKLQYYTSEPYSSPTNIWPITNKTIDAKSVLVLWLMKYDYPNLPLSEFNEAYGVTLTPEQVYAVKLTTSAQGLHDTAKRKVGVAAPGGQLVTSTYINADVPDGIAGRSVTYMPQAGGIEMVKIANNQPSTPGVLVTGQVHGPTAPSGLKAKAGDSVSLLEWDRNPESDVTAYKIYMAQSTAIATVADTSYTVEGLTNGTQYQFRVTAVDANGDESPATSAVTVKPHPIYDLEPPAPPVGLTAIPGKGVVTLNWTPNAEPDLAGYQIYVDGKLRQVVPAPANTATVGPLDFGRRYTFELTAMDTSENESDKSAPVTAEPELLPVPSLLITELVPDSNNYAGYDAHEFVELYNTTSEAISLQGYTLRLESSTPSSSWEYTLSEPAVIGPGDTFLLWTRKAELHSLTLEGFNHYYYDTYFNKYVNADHMYIVEGVSGLYNTSEQTVLIKDPSGNEISRATYNNNSSDVAEGKSIVYGYPADGSKVMRKIASKQVSTPGRLSAGQAPPPQMTNDQSPAAPSQVNAVPGNGTVSLSWAPGSEQDIMEYNIYKNGILENTLPASEHLTTVYMLIGNVPYSFEVSAINSSGKESDRSAQVTVTPDHAIATQQERTANPKNDAYAMLWNTGTEGPIIPGLAEDLIPQGTAYYPDKDWLLVSSYFSDDRPSRLSVIDLQTGQLIKSLILLEEDGKRYIGHAGGVAVSGQHAWIASGNYLYRLDLNDIVQAANNGEVRFKDRFATPTRASFTTYADGVLYVGDYYEEDGYPTEANHLLVNRDGDLYHAWIAGYRLDSQTDLLPSSKVNDGIQSVTPDLILSIQDQIQGAVIRGDGIVLSKSTSRYANSYLYRFNNPINEAPHTMVTYGTDSVPVWFLDGKNKADTNNQLTMPPMSENVLDVNGSLYVLYESGANLYRYTTTYVLDRLQIVDLNLWKTYGQYEIRGIPQLMEVGADAHAQAVQLFGNAASLDVTANASWSSSDPDIVEVSGEGMVIAKKEGVAVITARIGSKSAPFQVKVKSPAVLQSIALHGLTPEISVGQHVQLKVEAQYDNGSKQDVTAMARYEATKDKSVEITPTGELIAKKPFVTVITVTYQGKTVDFRLKINQK